MSEVTYYGAIGIAVALWFAMGTYLNMQLKQVNARIDLVLEDLDGLRAYLYEIDPQFDEERRLLTDLFSETGSAFSGMHHSELTTEKKEGGYRTLNSTFREGGFRAPRR